MIDGNANRESKLALHQIEALKSVIRTLEAQLASIEKKLSIINETCYNMGIDLRVLVAERNAKVDVVGTKIIVPEKIMGIN